MSVLDPESIIKTGGLVAIGAIVFAESGLLIGFFLPGDTLLFAAGLFASQGYFNIITLMAVVVACAIIGDNVGYTIGRKAGPRLFKKEDGIIFRQEYVARAEAFYEKHGGKTIIIARFVPIVRTFAPVVAGVGKMSRRRFFAYNVIGALIWGIGVPLLGFYFGSKIPNIDTYILPIMGAVIILSFGPALYHILSDKRSRNLIKTKLKKSWSYLRLNQR